MQIILGEARRRWSEEEKRAVVAETYVELPPKRWTPLLSSFWSRKVFYGYGTSSIYG
jgi:hypothetical protein